jgi:3-oxoacyl-[acyl-carrier-protein] synthase-3
MNGREVFRFASRVMVSATNEVIEKAGLTIDEVDMVVPHQANLRIIQAAARGLKLPEDKFIVNVDRYGNTSTASIPIALVEGVEDGRIKRNDRLVLVGFGGGLTWGAAIVEWHVEPTQLSRTRDLMREAFYLLAGLRSYVLRLFRFLEGVLFGSPTPKATLRDAERRQSEDE